MNKHNKTELLLKFILMHLFLQRDVRMNNVKNLRQYTSRREKHKLVLFYKMINSLAPQYLSSLVPPTVGNISQ